MRGENGGGYLLTNAPGESVWDRARDVPVEPGPAGTTGRMGSIFYWLDNNGDLKDHVGHQVEIDGELKGDLNDGQIKVDRKANWSEMEVKSDGKTLKAQVPAVAVRLPGREARQRSEGPCPGAERSTSRRCRCGPRPARSRWLVQSSCRCS